MLFRRKLLDYLLKWKDSKHRKPLIIRGARQVGKSTLVQQFGVNYSHFISINLEKKEYRNIFEKIDRTKNILDAIYLQTSTPREKGTTLLFIDEIQESPKAIQQLRYFYEDYPDLHIIAAGSLLEFMMGEVGSFPVGRVEQVVLHPLDFDEFLNATGQTALQSQLRQIPIAPYAHEALLEQFHQYIIIGGMPEVVQQFASDNTLANLPSLHTNLWQSYRDDVEKYAKNTKERHLIRYIMQAAPSEMDRVNFSSFAQTQYSARQVQEAFRALDYARIIRLIYPTTNLKPPIFPNLKRRPRLQFLDTALLITALGLQNEFLVINDMNPSMRGRIIQHLISQELIAQSTLPLYQAAFWVRENAKSSAEVDIVFQSGSYLIPIEVKSGKQGRLRSLHQFVERSNCPFAVRLLRNTASIEEVKTPKGVPYQLLNLPYYLGSQLPQYIKQFIAGELFL